MATKRLTRGRAMEMAHEAAELYDDALRLFEQRRPLFVERMEMFAGHHWQERNPWASLVGRNPQHEASEVVNYTRAIVRSVTAERLQSLLNPGSVPVHSDVRSRMRAKASFHLMRSFLRGDVFPFDQNHRGTLSSCIYGPVWWKTFWDMDAGEFYREPILDPETGEPAVDDFGQARSRIERDGDARVMFVDVFDALPGPHARCSNSTNYIVHRKKLALSEAMSRFPQDAFGKRLDAGDWTRAVGTDYSAQAERDMTEGGLAYHVAPGGERAKRNADVLVYELWERPSHEFPAGRLIVWAGGVSVVAVLYVGPMPHAWPWDLLNSENHKPAALYADGPVADAIPLQRTLNFIASTKREWMAKIPHPPLLNPNGSGIDPDEYTDVAGAILGYNIGYKPEWMQVPEIPQSLANYEADVVAQMKDITMSSDVSRGEVPPGVSSARMMAFMEHLQKGARAPNISEYQLCMVSILKKALGLYRDLAPEGRLLNVLGPNNRWLVRPFKRADYDFDISIQVEPFSGAPVSRALRYAERLEAFGAGLYDNERPGAREVRRDLDLDLDNDETFEHESRHRNRALAEQEALLSGELHRIRALPQDRHDLHLEVDEDFMITPEFLDLPEDVQQFYYAHVQEHEQHMLMQQQSFAQDTAPLGGQTQGMDGGPPPPKQPGAPSPADGGNPINPGSTEIAKGVQEARDEAAALAEG